MLRSNEFDLMISATHIERRKQSIKNVYISLYLRFGRE